MQKFIAYDMVNWIPKGRRKAQMCVIIAVIPAGKLPHELSPLYFGFPGKHQRRDHESYIIEDLTGYLHWPQTADLMLEECPMELRPLSFRPPTDPGYVEAVDEENVTEV